MAASESIQAIRSSAAQLSKFVAVVTALRDAQRLYYKSKNFDVLKKARALEKQVDEESAKALKSVSIILNITN